MAVIQERKNKNGKTMYRALVRMKGHPPQSATFERKTDARKWAQDIESAIRQGRHFKSSEAKKHTVSDMIDRYSELVLPNRPKNSKNHEIHLRWWREQIGYFLLSEINSAKIVECRDQLLKEKTKRGTLRSPATANRYLATLSHVFNIAVREWEWLEANPVSRLKKQTESRGRVRFLDDDERERLLEACRKSSSPNIYTVVVLAISTGMRQGEIMNLKWKDVDLKRRRIVIQETKNNERRSVPLTGLAHQVMKDFSKVRRLDSEFVFPGRDSDKPADIRTAWIESVKTARIEDFRFHDLRHTAASYLAMNGATLAEIAEVLGHKTLQMVKRYAHLSEAHTTSVVERMNNNIFN